MYGSAVNLEQSAIMISPALHAELKSKTDQIVTELKSKTDQMVIEALQKHHGMGTITQESQSVDTDSNCHSLNDYQSCMRPEWSPKTPHEVHCSANQSLDSTLLRGSKQLRTKHTDDITKSQEIQSLHQQLQANKLNLTSLQEERTSVIHKIIEQQASCSLFLQQTVKENKELALENSKLKENQQQDQLLLHNQACEIENLKSTIEEYSKELQKTNHTVQHYKEHISELQKHLTEVKETSEKNITEIMFQMQTEKETATKDQEIIHAKNLEVVMDDYRQQLQSMDIEKANLTSKCDNFEKILAEINQTSENLRTENSGLKKQLTLVHRKDKKTHQLLQASKRETEESMCKSAELESTLNELQQRHIVLQNKNTAEAKQLEATIEHLHSNLVELGNEKKQAVKTIGSLNYQLETKEQIARQKQSELQADIIKQKNLIQGLVLYIPNIMKTGHLQQSTTKMCTTGQVYAPSSLFSLAIESLKISQLHKQCMHESINQRCFHTKLPESGIYKLTTANELYILCCFLVYLCLMLL